MQLLLHFIDIDEWKEGGHQVLDKWTGIHQADPTVQQHSWALEIWLLLVPAITKEAYSALSTQVLMDKVLV